MPPLSLNDEQMDFVTRAAAMLPPQQRDSFLRSIANRLADVARPTNFDVRHGDRFRHRLRIGGGSRAFLSNHRNKRKDFSDEENQILRFPWERGRRAYRL